MEEKKIVEKDLEEGVEILKERSEKVKKFLKQKIDWLVYLILAFIVWISVYIRTRNIPLLKDISTGTWTLGPDLDPFLFLRWAKYIIENGSLMVLDTMRYVPLGFDTAREMKLLSYLIAWFHKTLSFLSLSDNVTYSAIIFPVFMAGLTAIAFFLFSRKIFEKEDKLTKNIIALVATTFFILIPSLLPRTIAGIPEKESAAFFFMFAAFYLFLCAFSSEKLKSKILFGIASGITTGLMALVWGGVMFVFVTIPATILLAFIFGKIKKNEFFIYSSWLISSLVIMLSFSAKYSFNGLINSPYTCLSLVVFALIGLSLLFAKSEKIMDFRKKTKLPKEIFLLICSGAIVLILILILLGPGTIYKQIIGIKNSLITPMTTRFGKTVAENQQPYFSSDWKGGFGPILFNIPAFFWLFFTGSIYLFNNLIRKLNKKEKIFLTFSYIVFLSCLIFSRYAPHPNLLDGEGNLSLLMYFGGILFFLGSFVYYFYKRYKIKESSVFKEFDLGYILYFIILTISIIGARGGIRLIMLLGAISPVAVSFLIVKTCKGFFREKEEVRKFFIGIILVGILVFSLFTLYNYYKQDKFTAENFAPTYYTQQWQLAMSWVRENIQKNAVFAHWWDYGYWVQSIGERATILDGSNSIIYWDYLMGRYVLTGTNEKDALEFLYAHNGTHLLIDSTDIGKYTAFSSIGSDENYDRFSWISTFVIDEKQTQETKNKTIYLYGGGTVLDDDIIWNENGKQIFLPKKKGVLGAIVIEKISSGEILQPQGIFIYNNQQYKIPLQYAYYKNELKDFGSGLDAGIFIYPQSNVQNNQMNINEIGALLYLSKRTVHSNLARLYLFGEKSDSFKLVHSEDNLIISQIKQQGTNIGEFIQYQGFQGPIKIWEINYPLDIQFKPEYLEKKFPNQELNLAKTGEY